MKPALGPGEGGPCSHRTNPRSRPGPCGYPRARCQVAGGGDKCPYRKGVLGALTPYDCYRDAEMVFSSLCPFPVPPGRLTMVHGDEGKVSGAISGRQ